MHTFLNFLCIEVVVFEIKLQKSMYLFKLNMNTVCFYIYCIQVYLHHSFTTRTTVTISGYPRVRQELPTINYSVVIAFMSQPLVDIT